MAFSRGNGAIPTDGLELYLDARNPRSYPGTGSVWKDLSGNYRDFTLDPGVVWSNGRFILNTDKGMTHVGPITTSGVSTLIYIMDTTDDRSLFLSLDVGGGDYVGAYRSTNKEYYGNTGGPTLFMDLVDVPNLFDFIRDGVPHMIEFKDVRFIDTWATTRFNQYTSSYSFGDGSIVAILCYNRILSSEESTQIYNTFKTRKDL
jgi:hypothetical protein